MASIASLIIDIAASVARLEQDMAKANQVVQRGFKGMELAAAGLKGLFAGIVAGFTVDAFKGFVQGGIDAADQLAHVSRRTGIAVEDISALKFATEQANVDFATFGTGLDRFAKNLAEAGISGTQLVPTLEALADRIQQTEDPAKRMQIAMAAFGKAAGPQLVEFLSQGADAIQAVTDQARAMGLVVSGDTANAAADFNDKLDQMRKVAQSAAIAIGGGLVKAFADFKVHGIDQETLNNLERFGKLLGNVSKAIIENIGWIGHLTTAYAGFRVGAGLGGTIGGVFGPAGAGIGGAVGGIAGGVAGYTAPGLMFEGNRSDIELYENKLAELKKQQQDMLRMRATGEAVNWLPSFASHGITTPLDKYLGEFLVPDKDLAEMQQRIDTATGMLEKLKAAAGTAGEATTAGTAKYQTELKKLLDTTLKTGEGATKAKDQFDALFAAAEARFRIPPGLLKSIADVETGGSFKPNLTSSAGAVGLMQFMPDTAQRFGVSNRLDPNQSIEGAAKYVAELLKRFGGDLVKTIGAYNAGEGRIEQATVNGQLQFAQLPPETRQYIPKVADKLLDYGSLKLDAGELIQAQALLEDLRRQALETRASLLALTGDEVGAGIIQIDLKYADLIDKLRQVGDEAGIALAEQAKAAELAQTRIQGALSDFSGRAGLREAQIRVTQTEAANQPLFGAFNEGDALAKLSDAEREHIALLKEKQALLRDLARTQGIDAQTYLDLQTQIADTQAQINEGLKGKVNEISQFAIEASRNIQDNFSNFFFDVFQGRLDDLGASFKAMLDRMLANALAANLAQALFGSSIASGSGAALGGLLGSLFGVGGGTAGAQADVSALVSTSGLFARGAAFRGGNVIPFARGGIVDRPTLFPLAQGTGLMGEAGPEAIVPLKRAAGGLGIQARLADGIHILPITRIGADLGVTLDTRPARLRAFAHGGVFGSTLPTVAAMDAPLRRYEHGGVVYPYELPRESAQTQAAKAATTPPSPPQQQTTVIHFNLPNVRDPSEFQRSVSQSSREAARLLERSTRRG